MNVLLITFSFPPAGGVGVLRALSLAKYLPEADIRVDVLTASNAPAVGRDLELLRQVPSSVTVHRTWTLDLPFGVRKRIKKLLFRNRSQKAPSSENTGNRNFAGRIRKIFANLLLPDPQIGWLPFAHPAARRIIRERNIDAVIITVPPFSSVKLAPKLRKMFPSLPIIVDFRDEWLSTTIRFVSFNKDQRAYDVARHTESDAVKAATTVVAVTENAVRELRKRYPEYGAEKFVCIPNGFDTAIQQPSIPSVSGKVLITYIGSVYGSTDPTTFLDAVAQLPPHIKSSLQIRFIGRIEGEAYQEAFKKVEEVVHLRGFVPQTEALSLLNESHYALLITHDPVNVSAKFYDYLGATKPILAAVHPEGEVKQMVEDLRAGWCADIDDSVSIRQMLVDAVYRAQKNENTYRPDLQKIALYHRQPLAQRYAQLLRGIGGVRS
ncbi:MAG: glycosyltransferase [Acidobacteria bacterium]|nr:glycosyltransferase [Acidobacteriota bacterium]